jgi:hypothetical protein
MATNNQSNVKIEDNWTIEPELGDTPPRRVLPSDYPDHNQPPTTHLYAVAGLLLLGGFVLFILGLNGQGGMFIGLGIVLILLSLGAGYWVSQMGNKHLARTRYLAENGIPVMARILASDNMGTEGGTKRLVRYQVQLPGGEMAHRQVHCDDRALPRRIPASVTALWDADSGDVELYCALPFKVVPKTASVPRPAHPTPTLPSRPAAPVTPIPTPATAARTTAPRSQPAPTMASTATITPAAPEDPLAGVPVAAPSTGMGMLGVPAAPKTKLDPVPATAPVPATVAADSAAPETTAPEAPAGATTPSKSADPWTDPQAEADGKTDKKDKKDKKATALPWE